MTMIKYDIIRERKTNTVLLWNIPQGKEDCVNISVDTRL